MNEHQDKDIWPNKCKHSDNEANCQILAMYCLCTALEPQIELKFVSRHLVEEVRNHRN